MKIILDIIIVAAIVFTAVYVYRVYGDDIQEYFIQESEVLIFIENLAVAVTVADERAERQRGLSGVESIGELEGKLFVFDEEGYHDIWMKDMLFPIDIIFINEEFKIVDIAENVVPETYPLTYTSSEPARFILETNAFFVDSFKIKEGQFVALPPRYIPSDLR